MLTEHFSIGIDVGGTNIRAARIADTGEILQKKSVAGSRDPHQALELIEALVREMDGPGHAARAIGVGTPGRVDGWTGDVISGGFLDLSSIPLKAYLRQTFGRPVAVANDCSMALIGESRRGAAAGVRDAVMMTIGTGIGGAVMQHGKVVNGKRCAGQFGHLVVKLNGQPCPCGQRGCIETESSGTALRRHIDAAGLSPQTRFEHLLQQAEAGDATALEVMHAWANPLRAAITTLSAAFDPDVVLLGGGMGSAALRAMTFLPAYCGWYDVDVRAAALDDDAGVIGAGLAAFDAIGKEPAAKPTKRLVMVNGVPASGKSSLSRQLAASTGWPVLALDTIKNPFLEAIDGVDRAFNRVLGKASYKSMFSVIKDAAPGTTFIVDAWFGFQPPEVLRDHLAMAGVTEVVEVWCDVPPDVAGDRYRRRTAERLPGHPGPEYIPELMALAARAEPARLGPVLNIDTTRELSIAKVVDWVGATLARSTEPRVELASVAMH